MSLKNWTHREFSTGSVTGKDFIMFSKDFKKFVKKSLPEGANLVEFNREHYYVSGFIEKDGKYVYFSISDVRYWPDEWSTNILVRTAKDATDYTGGGNNYTNLEDFGEDVLRLLG